ncbi:MAG: glycosyltransferase family 1 protein [Patescibacteria group bacterium]
MTNVKFVLYFKDEISQDVLKSDLFECKLLKVGSTAKFTHCDLPRAAAKDKVDILFCPAYVAPFFYKGKIALTLHDISYEARPKDFNWLSWADKILLKWVSRQAAKKASVIFTPSEFSRQEIIKYYNAPGEKVVTTPLAVDLSLFEKFDSPASGTVLIDEIKKKYGIKDKFIFYVGSIFTRRHLPEIIAAFERLAKENDYQLLLGGKDYTDNKSVDKLAKEINAKLGREAILRIDFISSYELKLLYSACAFFIWLSDYEGFGLPVLEAMSLGAPVITTSGSSLSEVAGEAALLIRDNADIEEIYQATHKITHDNILREELISRGKEQAAKFSWQECAEKTLEKLLISN